MDQRMVTMTAEKMASEIASAGRVALYGIYFDTDKTDVKPESEAALNEIAKLLTGNPSLKVSIVGHTDNAGTFEHNMDLSQRRAVIAQPLNGFKLRRAGCGRWGLLRLPRLRPTIARKEGRRIAALN